MNTSLNLRLAALATLALTSFGYSSSAIAAPLFDQQEVDQGKYTVVASPYGGNAHQLLILEQISNIRPCWSESGAGPTTVNPLLVEFDFTDICSRSTDSNGYSIRVGQEDLGWRYSFRVVRRGNDLLLLGVPNVDRSAPEILIGRTQGYTPGFAKFYLEPGWRLTKRSYQGTVTGHIYLTNNQSLASLNAAAIASRPATTAPISTAPVVTTPISTSPISTTPIATAPVNPVVTVNPTPSIQTPRPIVTQPQPKPAQQRRLTWWQRIFGGR